MSVNPVLMQVLQATAELYGKTMSRVAAEIFIEDLRRYPEPQILSALAKCRRELRTFPTTADVIARLEDGHPGVEEAWAMIPKDEDGSVVWTEEMAGAFGVARPLIREGDLIAARMAFKESYQRLVAESRQRFKTPRWSPSLGFEKSGREAALSEAVEKGRLTKQEAMLLLPERANALQIRKIAQLVFKDMPK